MYPLIFMDIESEIPSESRSVVLTLCKIRHAVRCSESKPRL